MNNDLDNPFSVTKATEFNNIEINDYWVDFNFKDKQSIIGILNPNEYLPKYVLGSKGCGKTHILRYFSYPIQKIRQSDNIAEVLRQDKYIGIYSVLDGLNSSRFQKKGVDSQKWQSVFEYYFELYICDSLLSIILDIFNGLKINADIQRNVITNVKNLFYTSDDTLNRVGDINEFKEYLNKLRRKIDLEIVNAPFKRDLEYESVRILFSPGDLIFGIPNVISKEIIEFDSIKFIYILDEYEKLFEWQKIFINSIVWDKKMPCTFWIGARKHGYTTRFTKFGEEIKQGSEYEPIVLDDLIRKNEDLYKKFANELYLKRLRKFYELKGLELTDSQLHNRFTDSFEKYSDEKLIEIIKQKFKNKPFQHIKKLRDNLIEGIKKQVAYGLKEEDVDTIVELILSKAEDNPLEQKYKILLFYKKWYDLKKDDDLFGAVKEVNLEYDKYLAFESSDFSNIVEKFKNDLIAQLTSENKIKNMCYSEIKDFIDISWGNPRSFILILKKVIELSRLRGERPLEEGSQISLETQYLAIYNTSKWFYEEAEIIGEEGKNLYKSISFLAEILRVNRFSDKPTETSVSCFNYKLEGLTDTAIKYIKLAELHSLIVRVNEGRKDKNSGREETLYQLNKTLAPLWNLPIIRRGTLSLDSDSIEAIFNPEFFEKFQTIYKEIKQRLNAPQFGKKKEIIKKPLTPPNPTLF